MTARTEPPGDQSLDDEQAWAGEPLAQFLAAAWRNTVNSFGAERQRYAALAEVDSVFRRLIENLADSPEHLSSTLVVRTHAAFLAAASLALSGQVAEAYVLLRQSLRAALQGLFVAGSPERQRFWASRNDDDDARRRMESEFSDAAMLSRLREVDAATAGIYQKLDQRTLDRSGHPNTFATLTRQTPADAAGNDFTRKYFVRDDDVRRSCLRSAVQVGICCLSIFFYVFGDEYRELELEAPINKLRQGH